MYSALFLNVLAAALLSRASAQDPNAAAGDANAGATAAAAAPVVASTPLVNKRFAYDQIPYMVDTDDGPRGTQQGFNLCNSTTQNQNSLCQTMLVNSIEDFCIWSSPTANGTIGNIEGESVAWCTKAGHGTRIIPQNALQGVQFMRTPSYVQVSGIIDQTLIDLTSDDTGGELDPHGADQRGNPLGGLVYSTVYGSGGNALPVQVIEWHNFMGANAFCIKACDPNAQNAAQMCQHIYDRTGCAFNAPSDAYTRPGQFESCAGDDQDPPGVYTENGAVMTYTQPPEGQDIGNLPYTPRVPASSSCTAYTSSAIYTDATSLAPAPSAHSVAASLGVSLADNTHTADATATPGSSDNSSGGGSMNIVPSLGAALLVAVISAFASFI